MTVAAVTAVMGGRRVFKRSQIERVDMTSLTRAGVPVAAFSELARALGVENKRLAAILGISERTLSRRLAGNHLLTADESDRTIRMARVVTHAMSTLGTIEKAAHWLKTPNRALGGEVPLEWLDTDAGVREVDTILGRIEYGLFS